MKSFKCLIGLHDYDLIAVYDRCTYNYVEYSEKVRITIDFYECKCCKKRSYEASAPEFKKHGYAKHLVKRWKKAGVLPKQKKVEKK